MYPTVVAQFDSIWTYVSSSYTNETSDGSELKLGDVQVLGIDYFLEWNLKMKDIVFTKKKRNTTVTQEKDQIWLELRSALCMRNQPMSINKVIQANLQSLICPLQQKLVIRLNSQIICVA